MDDFTYDIVQKKRIARGAAHMKRGSKSKKCGLPSDYLTAKQLKERNGPVMSYAMNSPMDWETFKSMPRDLQQTYLDGLGSRFNVGFTIASRELFGMSNSTLNVYAKRAGLKPSTLGIRLSETEREIWENWLNPPVPNTDAEPEDTHDTQEPDGEDTIIEEPVPAPEAPKPEPQLFSPGGINYYDQLGIPTKYQTETKQTEPLGLDYLSATFKGEFNPERFMQWISKLPMPDGNVSISVEVRAR